MIQIDPCQIKRHENSNVTTRAAKILEKKCPGTRLRVKRVPGTRLCFPGGVETSTLEAGAVGYLKQSTFCNWNTVRLTDVVCCKYLADECLVFIVFSMEKNIHVSAPGKVIVFGEHAVVYGKQALAASLDLRTELKIQEIDNKIINLILPSINLNLSWTIEELQRLKNSSNELYSFSKSTECADVDYLKTFMSSTDENTTKELAVIAFLHLFRCIILSTDKKQLKGMNIIVTSLIPTSAGLGSSAAYSVCLSAGFLAYAGAYNDMSSLSDLSNRTNKSSGAKNKDSICLNKKDLVLINDWAFIAEKIIHGKPSGIDNSVSTFGSAMWYKSGMISPVENMPHLKILLVNTKISRNTKNLVQQVRLKKEKYSSIIDPILESIEAITNQFKTQLDKTDNHFYSDLKELVAINQSLLKCLGVSHSSIENICFVFQKYNLEGKLTGAGGGGCVFTFIPPDFPTENLSLMELELQKMNHDCFTTILGGEGVKIHALL